MVQKLESEKIERGPLLDLARRADADESLRGIHLLTREGREALAVDLAQIDGKPVERIAA